MNMSQAHPELSVSASPAAINVEEVAYGHLSYLAQLPGLLPAHSHSREDMKNALAYLSSLVVRTVPRRVPGDTTMVMSTIVEILGIEAGSTAIFSGHLEAAVDRMLEEVALSNDRNSSTARGGLVGDAVLDARVDGTVGAGVPGSGKASVGARPGPGSLGVGSSSNSGGIDMDALNTSLDGLSMGFPMAADMQAVNRSAVTGVVGASTAGRVQGGGIYGGAVSSSGLGGNGGMVNGGEVRLNYGDPTSLGAVMPPGLVVGAGTSGGRLLGGGVGSGADTFRTMAPAVTSPSSTTKNVEDFLPDDADLLDDRDLLGFCLPDSIDDLTSDPASPFPAAAAAAAVAPGLSLNASAPVFVPRRSVPTQLDDHRHAHAFMPSNGSPGSVQGQLLKGSPPFSRQLPFGATGPDGNGAGADKQQHGDIPPQEFNDALNLLQTNAPGYDVESLISIFAANDYDVALTLDVIAHLEIEGGEDHSKGEVASQPAPVLNDLNFPSLSSALPSTPPASKGGTKTKASKNKASSSEQRSQMDDHTTTTTFDLDAVRDL